MKGSQVSMPSRPNNSDVSLAGCYYDHFNAHFSSPVTRKVFGVGNKDSFLQILTYEKVFEGCTSFATIGLSHFPKELGSLCEVFCAVEQGEGDVPYVLSNALYYMVENKRPLQRGAYLSGVENISPAFFGKFGKDALYFTAPLGLPETFETVACNNLTGTVYMVSFITKAELSFLRHNGSDALENLFAENDIDPFSLIRASCI